MRVLVPEGTPKDRLKQSNASLIDMMRATMSFFLRAKYYSDALTLAKLSADVADAFEIEGSMCKAMLTQTVMIILMGDIVRVSTIFQFNIHPLPLSLLIQYGI